MNHEIEKRFYTRLFVTMVCWAAVGVCVVLLLGWITAHFNNLVADWLAVRLDLIYVIYLIVGFLGIFHHFWQKPWGYLDEVVEATEAVYEKDGRSICLSTPLRDVENHLNEIKQSVLSSERELAEAEGKKNELVMYLAHDIRTPLTTVLGYLNLLDEAPDMPKEQREKYVSIALAKSERINVLINELFDLTRYNTKEVPLHKSNTDLSCLLAQVKDEFFPALVSKGHVVNLLAEEGLTLLADSDLLARAFGNILKNAASYSDEGSPISILSKREGNNALVIFRNEGDTVSPEQLVRMFDKFYRLDRARSTETGGAGLGLPIAKEIVELHGGTITAQSEDRIIQIVITLPLLL